jgi:hypothetical protein
VFSLSLRNVELLLAERGVVVSYRDCSSVVREVWPDLREPFASPPTTARGQVAPGWCVTNTFPKLEMWSCMRDEGGPLGAGSQVQASNHCKLLSSKAMVVLCQEDARASCCKRDEGGPFEAVL